MTPSRNFNYVLYYFNTFLKMHFKKRIEENTLNPVMSSQQPTDTCLHFDGAPPNGPHSLANKVNIHFCGIFL